MSERISLWSAIKADTFRQYGRFGWLLVFKGLITRRTYRLVVSMRLCQAVAHSHGVVRLLLPFVRVGHRITTHLAAVDFPWKTEVGAGLAITHGWGMVINEGARIGSNVTLFHGVTLGRRDRLSLGGGRLIEYPVLEDEVWVGPHAIIVGGITIGRGSRIAGGAFVTESVPPYSVVSGNPATIVKGDCVPDVMNPAPV